MEARQPTIPPTWHWQGHWEARAAHCLPHETHLGDHRHAQSVGSGHGKLMGSEATRPLPSHHHFGASGICSSSRFFLPVGVSLESQKKNELISNFPQEAETQTILEQTKLGLLKQLSELCHQGKQLISAFWISLLSFSLVWPLLGHSYLSLFS